MITRKDMQSARRSFEEHLRVSSDLQHSQHQVEVSPQARRFWNAR